MTNHPYLTGAAAEAHGQRLLDEAAHSRMVREARNTTNTANRTFRPARFHVRFAGRFQTAPRTA